LIDELNMSKDLTHKLNSQSKIVKFLEVGEINNNSAISNNNMKERKTEVIVREIMTNCRLELEKL